MKSTEALAISRNLVRRPRLIVIDRPEAAESTLLVGGPGPGARAKDWDTVRVLSALMGSGADGRLTRSLRDDRALTLFARSSVVACGGASVVGWNARFANARVGEALAEVAKQVDVLRDHEVSPAELAIVRERMLRSIPAEFATVDNASNIVAWRAVRGVPVTHLSALGDPLNAITPADVHRVAQRAFATDAAKFVVAGDWSVLKPQLVALGWGPIEIHDATGALVRVEAPVP